MITWPVILLATCCALVNGCQFLPAGEYLRFVRLPENLPVGGEVLQVEVHPRHGLSLQPIDKAEDATYFEVHELSSQLVSVALARSLEDLVDGDSPQNVLKFRLVCDYQDGDDTISSFLSVTVYVEDVNDHSPVFVNAPYHVTVDELTPVGATLFREVRAVDGDKPNTANSEVALSIVAGDGGGRFSLEGAPRAALVLRRPLDYDAGDVEFDLTLLAVDHGTPPRNATTQLVVSVVDNDDLPPKFTRDVYRTQINEFYPITGARIHQEVRFSPPIQAYDQDASLNAALRYDIVSGNEQRWFSVDAQNGSVFLEREVDRERAGQPAVLSLQLQASQVDRPLRAAHARLEVAILDLNDNLPEFEVDAYNISIVENLPNGFSVLQVAATDRDQGENAEFWFELEDPEQAFSVEADSGWLTVRDQSKLDREARPSLSMWVVARERAPSVAAPADAASRVAVEVTLLDANDNNPAFQPDNLYSFSVRQDAAPGTVVGKVLATDADLGRNGQVVYSVQAAGGANGSGSGTPTSSFTVDAQTGEVAVAPGARLGPGRHALFVQASDQPDNPSERRFSIAVVSVDVLPAGRPGGEGGVEPDFVGAPYEFWVGSTVPVGTSVGQLRTNDAVDARSAVFDLLHSFHQGVPFAVEERSGVISVVDEIGKYSPTLYDFEAVVAADPDIALVTNVTIHVVKLDGAQPQDIKQEVELHVLENQPASVVGRLPAPAQQSAQGVEVRYSLANGHEEAARSLAVGADGSLLALRPLDRESRDVFHLTALAETHSGIAAVYQVTVFVDDENDNAPVFEQPRYEGWVREDAAPGAEVRLQPRAVRATDLDAGRHGAFSLALRGDGSHLFSLDAANGRLHLRAPLDREQADRYQLTVVARDTGNLTSEASLVVHVTDVNDNAPRFVQLVVLAADPRRSEVRNVSGAGAVEVSVPESAPTSAPLLRLVAEDRDDGDNASIAFSLASEVLAAGPRSPWSVPHYRSVAESLNSSDAFLQLDASDGPLDSSGWARTQYRTSREDGRERWTVTRYADDADATADTTADDAWQTASRRRPEWAQPPPSAPADNATGYFFAVHRTRGEIRPLRRLPAETTFLLQVVATDGPGLSDSLELRIRVLDVNDHAPEFERPWYRFEVAEWNSTSGREQEVGRVVARDLDHGENARLSYQLVQPEGDKQELPFRLGASDGVLTAVRPLDREQREVYAFQVRATDQAPAKLRRSATVDVQVVVLDVNDNAPTFEGFSAIETDVAGRPVAVYRASVRESAPAGLEVLRLAASDADAGRNALLLFSLADAAAASGTGASVSPRRRPLLPPPPPPPLSVDPRSGVVTLSAGAAPLDAERQPLITARVIAADLGAPSLTATALIQVEVQPEPEGAPSRAAVFSPRYLEVSVEENCEVPLAVAALNVSAEYRGLPLNLSVAPSPHAGWFSVAGGNGSLLLVVSPDREATPRLHVTVRAAYSRRARLLQLYPPDLSDLGHDEARVVVVVRDVNDNSPRFLGSGRPFVAAIPTSTTYGHHILTVKAEDADEGLNGEVRYSLLGGGSGPQARFAVDAASGRVRALASFRRDAGRVFGFDVKATDRRGADDGRSTIANVLVYVLDDDKQVVMVVATKPTMVEKNVENITTALYNATGLDVRVRKLEPHMSRDNEIVSGTDLYLYAVDPHMNAVIDMDTLQNVLTARQSDVRRRLERFRVLQVSAPPPAPASRPPAPAAAGRWLSSLEAVVLALGLVVFVGAFATAVCIGCARRKNRLRRQEELGKALTSPFTLSAAPPGGAYNGDTTDTYVDMHSRRSGDSGGALRHGHQQRHHRHHRHHPGCARAAHGLQASLASLHSRDSGVGGSHRPQAAGGRCVCGHSTSHSSDSSGGSYEDSLKGGHARRSAAPSRRQRQRHSSASAASSLAAAPAAPAPPTPCLPPPSGRASPCATLGRRPSQRDAASVR